ncbi:hypothetical protein JGU66_18660 [Myxococcaceae bacterium JPH2]|nr:hypothetical protein [Myxococcaceae bacterium JPH2]
MAIIAGLMAVGMLAGCGGEEGASMAESLNADSATGVSAQPLSVCTTACYYAYKDCMRSANGNASAEDVCDNEWDACIVACPPRQH